MQLMTSWERKGRQEGQAATIKRQLRILLGKVTPIQQKTIDSLAEEQLSDLAEALLEFSSVRDLERWLARHRP